jgi:hypothetical protein
MKTALLAAEGIALETNRTGALAYRDSQLDQETMLPCMMNNQCSTFFELYSYLGKTPSGEESQSSR